MNPTINPYAPGAGTPPPELAGRDSILENARLYIARNRLGKPARSFMFVGLRGVGKTVLLNEVQSIAEEEGAITEFFEVNNNSSLSVEIVASLRAALLKLDRIKGVNEQVKRGLRVLKSFVSVLRMKYKDLEFSIGVDNEIGVADSGTLSRDLADLFVAVGAAAKARKKSIVVLIDEIQNLPTEEFEALIIAVHKTNQKNLPIMIVGAGLPQLITLSANTKSYVERLFEYPTIGSLDDDAARRALIAPAMEAKVEFNEDAVNSIVQQTKGYPYFLQEWRYQAWNIAKKSPITIADIRKASKLALKRLDENFFRSRYVRLTDSQRDYLMAMSELGSGPYKTSEIAKKMGKKSSALAMTREALITSGMIYSPRWGYAEYTVPLFDEYMKRVNK